MKQSNPIDEANCPISKCVDSFIPAHSAIYVAPLPTCSIQRVCHNTLDFISVPGLPGAICFFVLTHSRRIVFNDSRGL